MVLAIRSFFFLMIRRPPRSTLFPTRRSSDLRAAAGGGRPDDVAGGRPRPWSVDHAPGAHQGEAPARRPAQQDRKSTRLNSSHANISYAVFCLKKKKKPYHVPINRIRTAHICP